MKTFKTLGLLTAIVLSSAGLANANPLTTDTLADLVSSDGSLSIGDKTFSGFTYAESGLTSFNAANIQVTASIVGGIYYLTWGGNISLADYTGTSTADLLLNYVVTASGGLINEIDQNYTGSIASGAGSIGIAETVTAPSGPTILGSTYLTTGITSEPALNLNSSEPFTPPSRLSM